MAYEFGSDFILVKFIDGTIYRYTEAMTGSAHFHKMVELAQSGQGLNSFISQVIKKKIAEKEP